MKSGTFSVSRKIWDHPVFKQEDYTEREAFLWLVSEASWEGRTVRAGRVIAELERGQLCASVRFISEAWGWSKSRVFRFLERLEKRDMIGTESGTGQMIITLCNYDDYQFGGDASGTVAGQKAGQKRDRSGTNDKKLINKKQNNTCSDDADFDAFWQVVPRKVGKPGARRAFAKAVKKDEAIVLIDGMKSYAEQRAGKDPQFTVHPATWLNDERWLDVESVDQRNWSSKPKSEWSDKDRTQAAMQWL